jgi:alpha-tubulin suppressor-like RCC1 family protein
LTSAGVVPAHTLVNSDLAAVNLGEGQAVRHIAAGQIHTCAILTDGAVKCWGDNSKGQLGLGDRDNRGDGLVANPQYSAEANPVDDPRDSENNLINCSVISKPLFPIECAGISSEMGDDLPLVALGVGVSAEALALGAKHSCVLTTAGELKCWGDNTYGQLGLGDTEHRGDEVIVELVDGETVTRSEMGDNLPVVQVSDELGVTIVQAVAGERHTCVLLTNTQVKCWGDNHYGQLGLGSQLGQLVPGASVDLGSGFVPVKLFAGAFHNCALSALGSVKCWGRNSAGQLGYEDLDARGDGRIPNPDFGAEEAADDAYCSSVDNSTTEAYFDESACPELAEMGDNLLSLTFPAGRSVIDLALGGLHSCAILDNTQIKCWGDAEHGQLGQEDKQDMSDGTILNPVYDAEIELVEGEELTACHVTLEYVASSCGIAELADETLSTEVF